MKIKFSLTRLIPKESRILVNENGVVTIGLQRSSKKTVLPAEIEINQNVGWLIGFWHAEGRKGTKKHYVVDVSNSNPYLLANWIKIVSEERDIKDTINIEARSTDTISDTLRVLENIKFSKRLNSKYKYTKPHYKVEIVNKVLYDVLTKIFELAQYNREFQIGYVAGFFDGDGYVSKEGYIDIRLEKNEFSKKSYELIKAVLEREEFLVKEYLKKQYRLQIIQKRFSKKFANTFPLVHESKIKRLNSS